MSSDLGRYLGLGKADPAEILGLGRKEDDRVRTPLGVTALDGEDDDFSSEDGGAGLGRPESRLEALVMVLLSGAVPLASACLTGGLSTDGRGTAAVRREIVSFCFFASFFSLSPSLLSLCITPVRKFRMEELLVAGGAFGGFKPISTDMMVVKG